MNEFLLHNFYWDDESSCVTYHAKYFIVSPNFKMETWVIVTSISAKESYADEQESVNSTEFPLDFLIEYIANEHLSGIKINYLKFFVIDNYSLYRLYTKTVRYEFLFFGGIRVKHALEKLDPNSKKDRELRTFFGIPNVFTEEMVVQKIKSFVGEEI